MTAGGVSPVGAGGDPGGVVGDDRYAGAATGWAEGATLVYRPLARALAACAPEPLASRLVLDVGAGTGVGSEALAEAGARVVAVDLSADMLGWRAGERPPSAVADVTRLPVANGVVDAAFAAFVLNHLTDPVAGLAELRRVVRPGGVVLADVFAESSTSPVRDAVDEVARAHGWVPPRWYDEMRTDAIPHLATVDRATAAVRAAGLESDVIDERPVDVGVTEPAQLVDYRFGQAQFAGWQSALDADARAAARRAAIDAIAEVMVPYRPVVVFLVARVP